MAVRWHKGDQIQLTFADRNALLNDIPDSDFFGMAQAPIIDSVREGISKRIHFGWHIDRSGSII